MIAPEKYYKERERLKDLESYSILDTLPEIDYDNLTAIAAEICGTPISLISLIDNKRQWFKSHHGLDATETPKEYAFCAHAINDPTNIFVIPDAREDNRFHDNPLVTSDPYVVFYAGVPLVTDEGMPLGTLCVIDNKPGSLTQNQLKTLAALSNQVMNLLKLRKNNALLEQALAGLKEKNQELERFASIAAHDLKSPLIGISGMTRVFLEEYGSKVDSEGLEMLELIEGSTDKLRRMIDGLLEYSRSDSVLKENKSVIAIDNLKEELTRLFGYEAELSVTWDTKLAEIITNRTAIDQILLNLVSNAIKYNDKKRVEITIGLTENESQYEFCVRDNGPGIAANYHDRIFRIFEIFAMADKFGRTGNGIGLATIKKLVEKMGGSIKVESEIGKGANFIFSIEK